MKYIDSEKLIAEIKRQKKAEGWCEVGKDTADVYYARGFRFACDNLLSFITSLQQEKPEVDLDTLVNEAFDKYSSVDGYGQLSASFNRAELYSFIKKIARKEE